jgi:quercetin dioxygenase-like cupin family protein
MPDHSYDDLTLDRFWDDLVDSSDADTQWVDPERAAVVRRIYALAEAPVPGAARERVRQRLLTSHESPTLDTEPFTPAEVLEFGVAPRQSAGQLILTRLPAHPVMRYAALAALLLLVLGGIIGSSRLVDRLRDDEPAMIQAPGLGPDTATPTDVTEKTLLDVVLTAEETRAAGRFGSIMGYYAVPPGSRESWPGSTDSAPEPKVWSVLSGIYTVHADQELQIARAGNDGRATAVAAGDEVRLGPGDSLFRPAGSVMELSNTGQEPVHLVVWTLGDINLREPSLPSNWVSLPCYPSGTGGAAPTGPTRLKLRLVTLSPKAVLSAPPGAYVQQVLDLTQEAPNLGQKSDYSLVNHGSESATLYVVSLEPAEISSGAITGTDESLAEFTVPADVFFNPDSGGDRLSLDAAHVTIPAGTTTTWKIDSPTSYPGPVVAYVLNGSVTFASEGPAQLIRADGDGTPEDLVPGSEATLMAGDSLTHRLQDQSIWTTGDTSTELVVGYVIATKITQHFLPDEWMHADLLSRDNAGPPPTGPSMIRIRQITMEPDGIVTFKPDVLKVPINPVGGPGFLGERSDGSITFTGATEPTTIYVFSIEPADGKSAASGLDTPAP